MENIGNQAVLLRKLTLKSIIGFGKYSDCTVGMVLSLRKTRLLRWYYYNCSNIDFNQEIKDLIGIYSDFEIKKPGVNPDVGIRLDHLKFASMGDKLRVKNVAILKKATKLDNLRKSKSYSYTTTKGYLQSKNHGR